MANGNISVQVFEARNIHARTGHKKNYLSSQETCSENESTSSTSEQLNSPAQVAVHLYTHNHLHKIPIYRQQYQTHTQPLSNLIWNETFTLNVDDKHTTLYVEVLDKRKGLLEHRKLATTNILLEEIFEKKELDNWYALFNEHNTSSGEIRLKISYQPN
ncbi:hypothetical protein K7432_013112 [Basidiobolus ranarum]|uniref:C2 domain-containing protein n=1 Tax=Basidiobolus ranarum TaxID=34480 RepID=A0ABR2VRA3_9FUNG